MATDVQLASQALGLLRANEITAFNDGSNEADICDLYYDDFKADILTRFQWNFALKKALLVATTAPVNEWRYAHDLPSECLRLWALYPSSAVGVKPINNYALQGQAGTREVHSNNSTLYAEYTVDVDEANFPGYFTHFFIHAFAALIAMPVTDDDALAAQMHRLAWGTPSEGEKGGKFAVATSIDALQQPPEVIAHSPFIDARFS